MRLFFLWLRCACAEALPGAAEPAIPAASAPLTSLSPNSLRFIIRMLLEHWGVQQIPSPFCHHRPDVDQPYHAGGEGTRVARVFGRACRYGGKRACTTCMLSLLP